MMVRQRHCSFVFLGVMCVSAALTTAAQGAGPTGASRPAGMAASSIVHSDAPAGIVYGLTVTTDAVPDFTSVDALIHDIIKPGMSDEDKCLAVWRTVYQNRFWKPDSRGAVEGRYGGVDPILYINNYTPSICSQDVSMCLALWAQMGYPGRKYELDGHTTSEAWWGGQWRHLDATLGIITKDDKGQITSVTESPKYGGRAWVKPQSYVSHNDGYIIGHRMDLTLRDGESLTRYWKPLSREPEYWQAGSNGKIPSDRGTRSKQTSLERTMALKPRQFDRLPANAAYANGMWSFAPDLTAGNWQAMTYGAINTVVADDNGVACLQPAQPGQDSTVTYRLRSPYVMTGGWIEGRFACAGDQDKIRIQVLSDNGAKRFEVYNNTGKTEDSKIPLYEAVNGELDCLVRIRMTSATAGGVKISGLKFQTVTMNNPLVLPALKLGENTVHVRAGEHLDRMTIQPPLNTPDYRWEILAEENVVTAREGRQEGWVQGLCAKALDKEGFVVFKVACPGDIKALRFGGSFTGTNDDTKLYYSLDNKTWTEKPWSYRQTVKDTPNEHRATVIDYETVDSPPAGTREMYVKFWFIRRGPIKENCDLHFANSLSIDADYVPPVPVMTAPVAVTYCWVENNGQQKTQKTHRQVVTGYPSDYKIIVGGDSEPTMQWVKVQALPLSPKQ